MTDPAYAFMVLETDGDGTVLRIKTVATGSEEECQDAYDAYSLVENETNSYVVPYADRHDPQ